MKNLTLSLGRLTLVLAGVLSLGACSRSEYAPLSRADSPGLSAPIGSPAAPYVPVAAEESATVKASAPAVADAALAPAVAPATPAAVVAAPAATVAATPAASSAATLAAVPATPKLNLVQRLALHKITKKIDKLASQVPQLKKRDASAARGGLDGNLRSAILFGLIGLIVLLFSGVSNIFAILGTIFLIIGLVFLVLWVLDQA